MSTPEWLFRPTPAHLCPCCTVGKPAKGSFVEKTIQDAAALLREAIFSEEMARRPGLLQGLDPRVKIATLVGLVVVAAFMRHLAPLALLYLFALVLAARSHIPLGFFISRVWLFIPLFTGLMVLPAVFNLITPGQPLLTLVDFGHPRRWGPLSLPEAVYITRQGAMGALLLVGRVAVCVSLMVLLALTTQWAELLKALRAVGIPKVFVLVLGMTYRYIFLLLSIASEMFVARQSRRVGRQRAAREGRRFIAAAMGTLLGKSLATSEEVYAAMVSRGYAGEPKVMSTFRLSRRDLAWSGAVLVVASLMVGGNRAFGL